MAKTRSPNYPTLPLSEAVAAIRPVFKGENRNKMSRIVLAKHMGYTSLNGRALSKIGAIRAFGLIEGSGDQIRVSDDAITIVTAPEGAPEKQAALQRCALHPSLFKDLRKAFPDDLPSHDNLRFNLIQRKFTEDAAEKAAKSFLSTMRIVSGDSEEYDSPENEAEQENMEHQQQFTKPPPPPKPGVQRAEFPLTEGTVRLDFPSALSSESFEDLEEWLNLILRRVKRSVTKTNS
ncbi:MAG TPA: hypothetical protein VGA60_03445 [Kiloniellales bacterium]|jgi:hypothetical protein